jgi:hypothetical protein
MKPEVLWIDDKPEDGMRYRACLIEVGVDVLVAPSAREAGLQMRSRRYDNIFLRPDLQLGGHSHVKFGGEGDSPVPFLEELLRSCHVDGPNSDTPLYLLVYHEQFSDEGSAIIRAAESVSECIPILEQDWIVYFNAHMKPSEFAWNVRGGIIGREMERYKKARELSRTDG